MKYVRRSRGFPWKSNEAISAKSFQWTTKLGSGVQANFCWIVEIMCLEMPIWINERTYGTFFARNCRHYRRYKFEDTIRMSFLLSFSYVIGKSVTRSAHLFILFHIVYLIYLCRRSQNLPTFSASEFITLNSHGLHRANIDVHMYDVVHAVTGHLGKLYRSAAFRAVGKEGRKKKRLNAARACETGREKNPWPMQGGRSGGMQPRQGHWWWYNKKKDRKFLAAFLSSPFSGSKDGRRGRRKCTPLYSPPVLADTHCFAILSRSFSLYNPQRIINQLFVLFYFIDLNNSSWLRDPYKDGW